MKILKPSIEDLQPLLNAATESQTIEEWTSKILRSFKALLLKNPIRYRAFGPYWWLVKQAMIDHGIKAFGTHVDVEWLESMNYADTSLNILASFGYEDMRFNLGLISDPFHSMEVDTAGETFEFVSADEEMEMKAAFNFIP